MNISKMKVMRCAWDVVPNEAVEPCSVCGKRVGVNSIHCATLGARVMFGSARKFGKSGTGFCVKNVQRWREKQLMSFPSKMSS